MPPQRLTDFARESTVTKRVAFGELFCRVRNNPTEQLTPDAEKLAVGRFAFLAFLAGDLGNLAGGPRLSGSRKFLWGPNPTPGLLPGARNSGAKLSDSLVYMGWAVNTRSVSNGELFSRRSSTPQRVRGDANPRRVVQPTRRRTNANCGRST